MHAQFVFDVDPTHNLICVSLAGFFEIPDIIKFCQARKLAHLELICGPNEHRTLVDIRHMRIQSQEAVREFGRMLMDSHYIAKQLAVVVSRNLTHKQMQRAAGERDARYFEEVEPAMHWLLTGDLAGIGPCTSVENRIHVL